MAAVVDARIAGRSYGFVVVPPKGLTVHGVKFPAGPRAAGKSGWYRLLLEAGAEAITQEDFEQRLSAVDPPAGGNKRARGRK